MYPGRCGGTRPRPQPQFLCEMGAARHKRHALGRRRKLQRPLEPVPHSRLQFPNLSHRSILSKALPLPPSGRSEPSWTQLGCSGPRRLRRDPRQAARARRGRLERMRLAHLACARLRAVPRMPRSCWVKDGGSHTTWVVGLVGYCSPLGLSLSSGAREWRRHPHEIR